MKGEDGGGKMEDGRGRERTKEKALRRGRKMEDEGKGQGRKMENGEGS